MNQILLIGGTDPSGAGLQTDLKIVHHLNASASSIVTAVTAQNSTGVKHSGILDASHFRAQLEAIQDQTFSAIKIGMLGDEHIITELLNFLQNLKENKPTVILDPVITSSSNGELLTSNGLKTLVSELLPLVDLLTPNIPEIEKLTNSTIESHEVLEEASNDLLKMGVSAVLVKGGHFTDEQNCTDFYCDADQQFYLLGQRWQDKHNVRGTGCALASAIACGIQKQFSLTDAIVYAKALISNGIKNSVNSNNQLQLHFTKHGEQNPFDLEDYPKLVKDLATLNTVLSGFEPVFLSCDTKRLGIYPVVDSFEWIKKLVDLDITTIQLRIKDQKDENVEEEIKQTIEYAKQKKVRLFINDYWRLAIKHKAYGIHLGQEDLDDANMQAIAESGCRLGVSTHSYTEVARAVGLKPSYLALGPIYATTSKDMPWIPQGVEAVNNWVELLGSVFSLVAIGGINHQRASDLKPTKVGSVAMISAITHAHDYKKATHDLINLWDS